MSTRAAIIAKIGTTYKGIYCHSDGYLDHTSRILLDHYTDPKKVEQLINLGDISILKEKVAPSGPHEWEYGKREPGVTVAYHRDRGEDFNIAYGDTADEVAKQIGHNGFVYVFEDGSWKCNDRPLVECMAATIPAN